MHIKICGITNIEDALQAVQAGATHLGLIFVEKSPRCATTEAAASIVEAVRGKVLTTGVFQNHNVENVAEIVAITGIDLIQLHGQENPEYCREVGNRTGKDLIKTITIDGEKKGSFMQDLSGYCAPGSPVKYLLFDRAKGAGGDGQAWLEAATAMLLDAGKTKALPPYFFAGGLTPENIGYVIEKIQPQGVDVASGVEASPGKKDPALVSKFIAEAKRQVVPGTH